RGAGPGRVRGVTQQSSPREFMTVEDVAAELRLGDRAVRKLVASGAIPALRLGRRWYILRTPLVARFPAAEGERGGGHRRDAAELDRVVRALAPHRSSVG